MSLYFLKHACAKVMLIEMHTWIRGNEITQIHPSITCMTFRKKKEKEANVSSKQIFNNKDNFRKIKENDS